MLENLKDRLLKREKVYKKLVNNEKILNDFIGTLPYNLDKSKLSATVYDHALFLYIYDVISNIEDIEINLIPIISTFTNAKWRKTVNEFSVLYSLNTIYSKISLYIFISAQFSDLCTVTKIPTGKTMLISKSINVEEPEYEIIYNCG